MTVGGNLTSVKCWRQCDRIRIRERGVRAFVREEPKTSMLGWESGCINCHWKMSLIVLVV